MMNKECIKMSEELFEKGLRVSAELTSAEFMICNIKTDSTVVLHEAHQMYIAARIAMNDFWVGLRIAMPQLPKGKLSIDWSTKEVFYQQEEKENENAISHRRITHAVRQHRACGHLR